MEKTVRQKFGIPSRKIWAQKLLISGSFTTIYMKKAVISSEKKQVQTDGKQICKLERASTIRQTLLLGQQQLVADFYRMSLSLPSCPHRGHWMRVGQTLPSVQKWARFEMDTPFKTYGQKMLILDGFKNNREYSGNETSHWLTIFNYVDFRYIFGDRDSLTVRANIDCLSRVGGHCRTLLYLYVLRHLIILIVLMSV